MEQSQMGIYLNPKEATVVRITSPYWIPEKLDWELVTSDSNATLVAIRETIKEMDLMPDPAAVHWGSLPLRE